MSSSSSTSSSEHAIGQVALSPLERIARVRSRWHGPWALVVFVLLVIVTEMLLAHHRVWFADRAAWQWEAKSRMLVRGQLQGDVALLGTSVMFHGADASIINQLVAEEKPERPLKVSNLALNGMQMHHITQMIEKELERGRRYDHILLELRDIELVRENWVGGPYWRFWASWQDMVRSDIPFHEPSQMVPFAANRLLTSSSYRDGLDNWLFASARVKKPATTYRDRNQRVEAFMVEHDGFSDGNFTTNLGGKPAPPLQPHDLMINPPGRYWLWRMLALCNDQQIHLTLLIPPSPSFVRRDRAASNYDAQLAHLLADIRRDFPSLKLDVLSPGPYADSDFADDLHYSKEGTQRFTRDIANWVLTLPAQDH